MTGEKINVTITIAGAMAATEVFSWKTESPISILACSVCGANANTGTIDVGLSTDPDGIIDGKDFGDSSSPALYRVADFNGALATAGQAHWINKDKIVQVTLTPGATAPTDTMVVLTLLEG